LTVGKQQQQQQEKKKKKKKKKIRRKKVDGGAGGGDGEFEGLTYGHDHFGDACAALRLRRN